MPSHLSPQIRTGPIVETLEIEPKQALERLAELIKEYDLKYDDELQADGIIYYYRAPSQAAAQSFIMQARALFNPHPEENLLCENTGGVPPSEWLRSDMIRANDTTTASIYDSRYGIGNWKAIFVKPSFSYYSKNEESDEEVIISFNVYSVYVGAIDADKVPKLEQPTN